MKQQGAKAVTEMIIEYGSDRYFVKVKQKLMASYNLKEVNRWTDAHENKSFLRCSN